MMLCLDCDIFEPGTRAAFQSFAFNLDARKKWMRKANDRTPKTSVFNEHVRAAAKNKEGQLVFAAKSKDGRQISFIGRLDIEIGRTAHTQRGAPGHRFVFPDYRCR